MICHQCERSLWAFYKKCPTCSAELFDSWLYKFLRWLGIGWRIALRGSLAYTVFICFSIDEAAPAGVAIVCAYLLLGRKAWAFTFAIHNDARAKMERQDFIISMLEKRVEKLESSITGP